jgi:Tfp pilus assembly protein PilV
MFGAKNKKNILENKKGLTIVEVIVVVFVISSGLLAAMSLVEKNFIAGHVNHNEIIASQLCQEGLEFCRNIRDNNWLNGDNWKTGAGASTNIISDWTYAVDSGGIINVTGIDDSLAKLYIDSSGFYVHSSSPKDSGFSRIINVKTETDASTTLECVVRWRKAGNAYDFTAQTVLYDWR